MKIVLGPVGAKTAVDLLAVLVSDDTLAGDELLDELDDAFDDALRSSIAQDEFTAKKDSQFAVASMGRVSAKRVVLLGLGPSGAVGTTEVRGACARAAKLANQDKATSLAIVLPGGSSAAIVRAAAEGITVGAYRFLKYFTGDRLPKKTLETVTLSTRASTGGKGRKDKGRNSDDTAANTALANGIAVGEAINLVRDLVNEPPNELTPEALADAALQVARAGKLKATVFDRERIQSEGMKLLDAVGRGSRNEPRFVHLAYTPAKGVKSRKRVVVVGKGLTFDSGGLCIKPAQGMGDMKSDMAGAALTVGFMAAVAALKPDVEVHGIFAAAENMPDGDAYRPGDVFGSLDGKTVEIINTDAEGRLVLADALAYARTLKPDTLIDHATLTGACVVALGQGTAGFYSNDEALATEYLAAAKRAGESMWRMPLLEELRESLKSDIADLKHTGDRWGGSITAALFLREFVGDSKWIHIDIAGPAFADRPTTLSPKGGTGYGLLSLLEYVEQR